MLSRQEISILAAQCPDSYSAIEYTANLFPLINKEQLERLIYCARMTGVSVNHIADLFLIEANRIKDTDLKILEKALLKFVL